MKYKASCIRADSYICVVTVYICIHLMHAVHNRACHPGFKILRKKKGAECTKCLAVSEAR